MIKTVLIMITAVCSVFGVYQQSNKYKNLDVMLKLAEYVSWPEDEEHSQITVMIAVKDSDCFEKASQYLERQFFNNRTIKTVFLDGDTEISEDADIIFVDTESGIDFGKLYCKIRDKHIMTVTDGKQHMEEGCMFYVSAGMDNNFDYLYNSRSVVASGIKIKSLLLTPKHDYELNNK